MLSNLGQDRKLEGNAHVSMPATARHYALAMNVIKHYRGQLTLRYMPLRYEELVRSPAAALRRVVEFIGADPAMVPDDAALRANPARPAAATPGHFMLREPVHGRGLFRYREYEKIMPNLFGEVRELLAPFIAEQGYAEATP
jgi:hypothetical protein